MGLFIDSAKIGGGLTIGSIAAQSGAQIIQSTIMRQNQKSYVAYKAQFYDKPVLDDLVDFFAHDRQMLPPRFEYPFPKDENPQAAQTPKGSVFSRHKVITGLLIASGVYVIVAGITALQTLGTANRADINPGPFMQVSTVGSFIIMALICSLIVALIKKGARGAKSGYENLASGAARRELHEFGERYWLVRQYVSNALAEGSITPQQAHEELFDTFLVQQLPYNWSELRAYTYSRRRQLGLA